jgi:hypothetical protein
MACREADAKYDPIFPPSFQTFGGLLPRLSRRSLALMKRAPTLERRTTVRYRLQLPVIFHWNDGIDHTEGGFTFDVALDGALILSSKCPPVGTEVRIEVLLPAPDHSGEEFRIECVGKVTRVFEHAHSGAFGVHGVFDDDHLTRHIPL